MASAINPPSDEAPDIIVGTRGSPLALAQAEEVRQRLTQAHDFLAGPNRIAIETIVTKGDRNRSQPLASLGGKELFTKELEDALLDGRIHLAQHCLKDLPTELPPGLVIAAILPRENPWDAFFAKGDLSLDELPRGAKLGTSSLRRAAFLLAYRPDLTIVDLRGNVGTRLAKIQGGEADATILAVAGLNRLGQAAKVREVLTPDILLPAPGQGAVALECREDDAEMRALLAPLSDPAAEATTSAERALLEALDGSCRTPIAALAELEGDRLRLRAAIARPDGSTVFEDADEGPVGDAAALGSAMGERLKERAGPRFFD